LVKQRKNKNTIIPLSERMEIVENIKFVDRVVVQDTMDKFEAYNRYHFNKMFV
jgi:glycerol-3-phosphate cytidylyltransferase